MKHSFKLNNLSRNPFKEIYKTDSDGTIKNKVKHLPEPISKPMII